MVDNVEVNEVNDARQKAGMTIKQLAAILHAPYSTIQDCCSGKHKPPAWVIRLILKEIKNFAAHARD